MLRWVFAIGCTIAVLAFSVGAQAREEAVNKITLQLRGLHSFQFAGYYVAKHKGFYKKAGLDVTIVEHDLNTSPIDVVLEGKADFGVSNSEILVRRLNGAPLVVLAAIFQHSPLMLLVPDGKGIFTPRDLRGKRVLMNTKSMDVDLLGMLQVEKIPLGEIEVVDRFARKADYFDDSFDALAAYSTDQPFYLSSMNIPYTIISPVTYGVDFYGDCLFTTEKQIAEHPERVKAFREASLKGWEYAMEHTDEIINLIVTKYHSTKSRNHLLFEAEAIREIMLPRLVEVGHMNPGRWQHIGQFLVRLGLSRNNAAFGNFIYNPDRPTGQGILKFSLVGLGVAVVCLAMGVLFLAHFYRRLQMQVQQSTETLSIKASELEKANMHLTELERVKSALLSAVSHELRTPITSILGFIKIVGREFNRTFASLADGDSLLEARRQRIRKNLDIISVEGERLTRLISDVLDLSKIESGQAIWRDSNIDVAELVRNSAVIVQESFTQNPETKLSIEIQPDLPMIHADPDRIIQVLINLVTNAVKFTPKGEVKLQATSEDGMVLLVVSDTGIGVAADDIEYIFDMFHQVRRGDTLRLGNQGAGLGLTITKEIVEHYGGTITLESKLGVGSTFIVKLPARKTFSHSQPVLHENSE